MGLDTAAVDYSYTKPATIDLVAAGYTVAMRYLGTDSRCLTPAERDRLFSARIKVGLIGQHSAATAEQSIKRPLGGRNAGRVDGPRFNSWADQLAFPDWVPIFYTVDVGFGFPAPGDLPAILEFFRGLLESSKRPVAGYGPYWVIEELAKLEHNGRRVEHLWQTAGASGSGDGSGGSIVTGDGSRRRLSRHACMFQHYGLTRIVPAGATDHNTVLPADDGTVADWAFNPLTQPNPGPGAPTTKDTTDMPFTVKCPNRTGDAIWIALPTLVRVLGDNPVQTSAVAKAGGGYVELFDQEADEFLRTYIQKDLHTVQWEAAILSNRTADLVKVALAEAVDELDDLELTDEQLEHLSAKVTTGVSAGLGTVVEDAVDRQLDQIAD